MNSEKNLCEAWDKKNPENCRVRKKKREREKRKEWEREKKEENFQPNKELN